MRRALVPGAPLVLALVLAVTGCSGGATGIPATAAPSVNGSMTTPSAAPSPTPVATPTADEPAASTVPACDQLFPIEQVRAMFDDDRIEARGEAIARDPALLPGPVAQATYAGATTTRTCGWAIPYSDGGFFITVVRADEAEVRELESALAASADYAAGRRGDVSVFSRPIPEGIGAYLAYGIERSVWVIVDGTLVDATRSETIAADVVATVIGSAS